MKITKQLRYALVPPQEGKTPIETCINGLQNLVQDFAASLGIPKGRIFGLATKEEILTSPRKQLIEYYLNAPETGDGSIIRIIFEEITKEEFLKDGS